MEKGTKVRVTKGVYSGVVGEIKEIDSHGGYSLIEVAKDSPRLANDKYIWVITELLEEVK